MVLQSSNSMHKKQEPTELNMKMFMADTACNSQTMCSLKGLAANKCSYGRKGLSLAYQGLNIATQVLGTVVSLLCGCVYVQTFAFCMLQTIPFICLGPYQVYSKIYASSVQLWESVKGATKTCIIHGAPEISS